VLRPVGVYGDTDGWDAEDDALVYVPVGNRTSSGERIILRGMIFGLLADDANGIALWSFLSSPLVRCLTTSSWKPPFVQSIQSVDGRAGETENEGIGIEPGNNMRRSAHRNPA
jgi:hypothetical protein